MLHKVLQTIQDFQMFPSGTHVVVGFSGGADSTALLFLLWSVQQQLGITVSAVHLNHCLRGEESERDEEFVRSFCESLEIPLHCARIDVRQKAEECKKSVEEFAREQRYRIFEQQAEQFGSRGKIATAHNMNDNAETVLFYLARGAGLNGMSGIPPVRGRIVRPLIRCSREEIEDFCSQHHLTYVTDSTNLEDTYTRNRIRHHLLPLMQQINAAALQNISKLSDNARQDEDFLEQTAQHEYQRILISQQPPVLDRLGFLKLHPAIQNRILLKFLQMVNLKPDFVKVCRMQERILAAKGKTELKRGVALLADEKKVVLDSQVFYREEKQPYFEKTFCEGENELFQGKSVCVTFCTQEEYKLFFKKDPSILKNAIDCDKIKKVAVFRQRKDGDRISLYHQKGSRPLKKMWNEAKTPQRQRWRAVLISDEEGVVWAEGFGCDQRVMPDQNSRKIALIQIKEDLA